MINFARRFMDMQNFFISLLNVVCEMAPYLLLGFFIAGVLHVFVPQRFYANYLSRNNKLSVVWAPFHIGLPDDDRGVCRPFRTAAQCHGNQLHYRCTGSLLHERICSAQSV